ncbi:MAG: sulfatase-like hydrolase/transferase [Lachnospiraceae bacterium]|nr:sulfatase-like hydrolase/transferase [Lachnospiraceae bacterium]
MKSKAGLIFTFLYIPLTFIYFEVLLKVLCSLKFTTVNVIVLVLVAAGAGFICDVLCSLTKSKVFNRILGLIILEAVAFVFMLAYFIYNSYSAFMSIESVVAGAGDVVDKFGDTIFTVIKNGVLQIVLFELPVLLYILLFFIIKVLNFIKVKALGKCFFIVLFLLFEVVGLLLIGSNSGGSKYLTSRFSYANTVKAYNLHTATWIDLAYLAFGKPSGKFDPADVVTEPTSEIEPDSETETTAIVYEDNVMDIDFDKLIAEEDNDTIRSIHEYVKSLKPSKQNEFTGMFAGKNIILITAEAFSKEVIDPVFTPTLYRMATKGIVFEDYYQPYWLGSTATGEFSNIMGIIPTNGVSSFYNTIGKNLYLTIGNQLMRQGYTSYAFHNGWYDYYYRNETHQNFGYEHWIAQGNGMTGITDQWPNSDLEMMEYSVPLFINEDHFSIYYMTISGHGAYAWAEGPYMQKYGDILADWDRSDFIKTYEADNMEFDRAMEYLINELEKAGKADDTLIVISTDHYPYCLEYSAAWYTDKNYIPELYGFEPQNEFEMHHSALIMWSGAFEKMDEPIVVSEPVYSIDILPTVSNLFGVDYDSRLLVGRDVFSDEEALCIWPDYSWISSLGYYDAATGTFTPKEGYTVDESYVDRINTKVANKLAFSANVLDYDYYNYLFPKDEE